MGREIRMVIPNWEHPRKENGGYKPLYDQSATDAFNEWLEGYQEFLAGDYESKCKEYDLPVNDLYSAYCEFWVSPPDAEYHRPHWEESEATWYQVYETVSEGTPVSPPFETKEALIEYLALNGDFWDQDRRKDARCSFMNNDPWGYERAKRFVEHEWAPSAVIVGGVLKSGTEL